MLRIVDGSWKRSEKLVVISFPKPKYLLQYNFVWSKYIIFQDIYAEKQKIRAFDYFLPKQDLVHDFHSMNYCGMSGGIT